jgi:type I restriction enzyme, S subunit
VHSDALVQGPTVIIGRKGSVGSTYLATGPSWPIDTAYYAQIPSQLSPQYIAYQLQAMRLQRLDSSTAIPSLRREDLEAQTIAVAPYPEQERIVAAIEEQFSRLDAGVAALERVRQNLKRMRTAVLQAAVTGQLVPTLGNPDDSLALGAQLRDEREAAGSRRVEPAPFKTTLSFPATWKVVSLAELAASIDYGTSKKTRIDVVGVPVLRMGNLGWGNITYGGLKYLPNAQLDPRLLLESGDLLFNRTNSAELVGKTAVFHGYTEPISFASYLIRVRPLPSANLDWASLVLNSSFGRGYVASARSQQVGQANVNGSKLAATPIPLPSAEEQERIVAESARLFSFIDTLGSAATAIQSDISSLQVSILAAAFSGKLVPQDPNDEPASPLLERIAAQLASSNGEKPGTRRRRTRVPA